MFNHNPSSIHIPDGIVDVSFRIISDLRLYSVVESQDQALLKVEISYSEATKDLAITKAKEIRAKNILLAKKI